jgi:hypothetical protein
MNNQKLTKPRNPKAKPGCPASGLLGSPVCISLQDYFLALHRNLKNGKALLVIKTSSLDLKIRKWLKSLPASLGEYDLAISPSEIGELNPANLKKAFKNRRNPRIIPHLIIGMFVVHKDMMFLWPNDQLTDRRRKRALAANPAFEKSGASKPQRLAAVRWSAWFGPILITTKGTAYL